MDQHQNRKVEIDAREDSFGDVVKMGKDLIARNHYATPEVKNYQYDYLVKSLVWGKESRGDHFLLVNCDSKLRGEEGG